MECVQPRPGPELKIALKAATEVTLGGRPPDGQRVFGAAALAARRQRWYRASTRLPSSSSLPRSSAMPIAPL